MYYEIFAKLCEERNVKPSDVSKATGISTATLTSWKKGKYTPKLEKLQLIADYFGVSVDYMMNGEQSDDDYYYLNEETRKMAQFLFEHPGHRVLFDASRNLTPEDLDAVIAIINRMTD